ncbi:hypothetical protein [Gellertiella hungarica]|uniref:Uncharacterized protein n=1 Tax=Gellertiella hungarica TaxID=1572859 RepID=A0A7W6J1I2_9HYPH|nr:hypothetical protein [Gellertiella hungarica]MBB4063012.1 hypothetical protein [Gellertiella hungarica]
MSEGSNRSNAIAAAVILLGAGLLFYAMPKIMLCIGEFSPILAGIFGAASVLAFFGIFWLRGRYQRRK